MVMAPGFEQLCLRHLPRCLGVEQGPRQLGCLVVGLDWGIILVICYLLQRGFTVIGARFTYPLIEQQKMDLVIWITAYFGALGQVFAAAALGLSASRIGRPTTM